MASQLASQLTQPCRLTALCKATSAVLSQKIAVLDALLNRVHATKAKEVYRAICPLMGTSVGQQYRHSMDPIEKVTLDAMSSVRDNDMLLNDIHYDLRDRGTDVEYDPFEAHQRLMFLKNNVDTVGRMSESEGELACKLDSTKPVTAYLMLDELGCTNGYEYKLNSSKLLFIVAFKLSKS